MTIPPLGPLRIALLTHSTNPRGGVVHGLELADALAALGHRVVLHAPGAGPFFRRPRHAETKVIPVRPLPPEAERREGLAALVRGRIADCVDYFSAAAAEPFDIYHAQDSITGNALADLGERGLIPGFLRTVHHIDDFADPVLAAFQRRAIERADHLLCVSDLWRDVLRRQWGRPAHRVANGVDRQRFTPRRNGREEELRRRFGLTDGPLFLMVGGIEPRKNSLRALEAFAIVHKHCETARLLIAGGASLLDHSRYRRDFREALAKFGLEPSVILTGPLADDDMPALYRLADLLLFPSVTEGFGLCVLEAMACGLPVAVSRIAPFTEYLGEEDCLWLDPAAPVSIARAMTCFLAPALDLRRRGLAVAARFPWSASARTHLGLYAAALSSRQEAFHA